MKKTDSSHESELSAEPKEGQDEKQVTNQPVSSADADTQEKEGPALPLAWISGAETTGLGLCNRDDHYMSAEASTIRRASVHVTT